MNPHWGEQIGLRERQHVEVAMVFQGLTREPGRGGLAAVPGLVAARATRCLECAVLDRWRSPRGDFWDADWLQAATPDVIARTTGPARRRKTSSGRATGQAGQFLHGYQSTWLPASLLKDDAARRARRRPLRREPPLELVAALQQGPGGRTGRRRSPRSRDTAMNPAVLDAFALVIIAGGPPGLPRHCRPRARPRRRRREAARHRPRDGRVAQAVPDAGSYVSESNFFEPDWQTLLLGCELPATAGGETTLRPRWPLLRASRRRQRGLERRWFHPGYSPLNRLAVAASDSLSRRSSRSSASARSASHSRSNFT